MSWTRFFICLCIGVWGEHLWFLFNPRAWEMRANGLTSPLGPWDLLTHQSLCLTSVDGSQLWQCIHKPLLWDHFFFCKGYWSFCIFLPAFSLKEWAGTETPPENYCFILTDNLTGWKPWKCLQKFKVAMRAQCNATHENICKFTKHDLCNKTLSSILQIVGCKLFEHNEK